MLDLQMLKTMPPGTMFATGVAMDKENELFMANTGKALRWVAIRGHGAFDWAVYCHFSDKDTAWVKRFGDKVGGEEHIRKLVPCDDEAYQKYRR